SFGALSLVPFESTGTTTFNFRLAPGAVTTGADTRGRDYRLKLQKQPGMASLPVSLTVLLPSGATNVRTTPKGRRTGDTWQLDLVLVQDTQVQLSFELP